MKVFGAGRLVVAVLLSSLPAFAYWPGSIVPRLGSRASHQTPATPARSARPRTARLKHVVPLVTRVGMLLVLGVLANELDHRHSQASISHARTPEELNLMGAGPAERALSRAYVWNARLVTRHLPGLFRPYSAEDLQGLRVAAGMEQYQREALMFSDHPEQAPHPAASLPVATYSAQPHATPPSDGPTTRAATGLPSEGPAR
jgi:hypothetical protein